MKRTFLFLFLFVLFAPGISGAAILYLKNGDRISGDILEESEFYVKIYTSVIGEMSVHKGFIDKIEDSKEEERTVEEEPAICPPTASPIIVVKPKYWDHHIAAGYQVSKGNNQSSSTNIMLDSRYQKDEQEWILKGMVDYATYQEKMSAQRYFARAQSNSRFIKGSKWFNSRALEYQHDRFAFLDYRLIPSIGVGYWFWENTKSKFEGDLSIGWEYSNYSDETKPTSETRLIPHIYYERILMKDLTITQDLGFYPSLEDLSDHRLRSETSIVKALSKRLSWRVSLIDERRNRPMGGAKKNDLMFMSYVEYSL
jgi:putative salt-induced outer membrane protein YdiY